jgi:thiamine-phosphate pyrophosphorylase
VREKHLDDRALLELVTSTRGVFDGTLIVNGRADIALAAGADGVHLPAAGPPAAKVVETFGDRLLVGLSTHDPAEIRCALEQGVDYVTFGPVFPTPSKEDLGQPVGVEALERACRIGIPVLALGGFCSGAQVAVARAAGAWGVAGIRGFERLSDLESAFTAGTPFGEAVNI